MGYFVLVVVLGVLLGGAGVLDGFGVLSVDDVEFGVVCIDFSGLSLM